MIRLIGFDERMEFLNDRGFFKLNFMRVNEIRTFRQKINKQMHKKAYPFDNNNNY